MMNDRSVMHDRHSDRLVNGNRHFPDNGHINMVSLLHWDRVWAVNRHKVGLGDLHVHRDVVRLLDDVRLRHMDNVGSGNLNLVVDSIGTLHFDGVRDGNIPRYRNLLMDGDVLFDDLWHRIRLRHRNSLVHGHTFVNWYGVRLRHIVGHWHRAGDLVDDDGRCCDRRMSVAVAAGVEASAVASSEGQSRIAKSMMA